MYLSFQKFESKSYRKMDFSSFHYYGDYLMLITIEPFKERKHGYIFRFHVEKALACISHIRHFKVNRTFSLMNTLYRAKVGIRQRFVAPRQRASLQSHLPKNDRPGDFHFKTRRLWNGDMQLYGCSVVYFGRVIFVNFKFRLLLSALYNQRDCPLFTLFTYVYFIPSGRELNSDMYWIQ